MDRIMILDADGPADPISCEPKKQGGQMTEKEETFELSSEPMEEKTKKPHRGRAVAIIAVAVIALLAAGGIVWKTHTDRLMAEAKAVSYTHLDVYKRQERVGPFLLASGEAQEIGHGFRGLVVEQVDLDVAFSGAHDNCSHGS